MTKFMGRPGCWQYYCRSSGRDLANHLIHSLAIAIVAAAVAIGVVANGVVL
jgi:hypothetical protein